MKYNKYLKKQTNKQSFPCRNPRFPGLITVPDIAGVDCLCCLKVNTGHFYNFICPFQSIVITPDVGNT